MKKLLLLLLCSIAICSSYAQTDETNIEQHLKFKGIPIDGTPSEFGEKLKASGFVYDTTLVGNPWYKGSFAGYYNCDICVKVHNNMVYEVAALLPQNYSWDHLYNSYSTLKEMLTTKYGEPWLNEEKFENTPPYVNIEDDNEKFREVKKGNCKYSAAYTSLKDGLGIIVIEIKDSGRIGLYYEDFTNSKKKQSSAINDL